jgi:hypothetical protein
MTFVLDKIIFGPILYLPAMFCRCRTSKIGDRRKDMSSYEKKSQTTAKRYDQEMRKVEISGGEDRSSVVARSDRNTYDWADVLRNLEPLY